MSAARFARNEKLEAFRGKTRLGVVKFKIELQIFKSEIFIPWIIKIKFKINKN